MKCYFGGGNFVLLDLDENLLHDLKKILGYNFIFLRYFTGNDNLLGKARVTVGTLEEMKFLLDKLEEFFNRKRK